MNAETLAAIDLGTNSFHLVVVRVLANGKTEIIGDEKEAVRLGSGGGDLGLIAPDAMERGLATLDRFTKIAKSHGARMRAVATSAVREATNKREFLAAVRKRCGLDIEVIQGTEEARLIYLGILQALPLYNQRILIIDIGGGSTELLIGRVGEPDYAVSRKLGAIRLKDRFFANEPVRAAAVESCRNAIRVDLAGVLEDLREIGFDVAVGSSGTAETLALMAAMADGEDRKDLRLSRAALDRVVAKIIAVPTHHRRAKLPGLDEKRADIIIGGAILLQEIVHGLEIEELQISPYALREGVIADTVARRSGSRAVIPDIRRRSVKQLAENLLGANTPALRNAWHVASLAVRILDQLAVNGFVDAEALELKLNDSLHLEVAGVLHNVGLRIAHSAHHKHSYYIIKNTDALLGFKRAEIELIAQTARYHRKALPHLKHAEFAALSEEHQQRVKLFSAILRIAVGLDRGYKQAVQKIELRRSNTTNRPSGNGGSNKDTLIFTLTADKGFRRRSKDLSLERWAAENRSEALADLLDVAIAYEIAES